MKTSSIFSRPLLLRYVWCLILFSCVMLSASSFAQIKLIKPSELIKTPVFKLTPNDTISRPMVRIASKNGRSYQTSYMPAKFDFADPIFLREFATTDQMVNNEFRSDASMRFYVSNAGSTRAIFSKIDDGIARSQNPIFSLDVSSVGADGKLSEQTRFQNTKFKELQVPALDGGSHDVAEFVIKVQSPDVHTSTGNLGSAPIGSKLTNAQSANFKFTLGDLPTTRVSTISAITVFKGEFLPTPSSKDTVSDFTVTVSASDDTPWRNWLQDANLRTQKKSGQIQFLSHDMKQILFTVTLNNVSIVSFHTESSQGSGSIQRSTVGLRAESVRFPPN